MALGGYRGAGALVACAVGSRLVAYRRKSTREEEPDNDSMWRRQSELEPIAAEAWQAEQLARAELITEDNPLFQAAHIEPMEAEELFDDVELRVEDF